MDSSDLKRFRKDKNMNQTEASKFFEVSQAFISQMERGECPVSDKIISKIKGDSKYYETIVSDRKGEYSVNKNIEVDPWAIIKSQQETINRLTDMLYEQNKKVQDASMGAGGAAVG